MNRYEVVIQDALNSYILDKKENVIVALCITKRPDLGFDKLKELVKRANTVDDMNCPMCEEIMETRIEEINSDAVVSGKEEIITGWDCECGYSLDLYER